MAQPLKETKEDLESDENEEEIVIDFIKIKHKKCDSIELFNTLQFFEQGLYIDIRPKKEYKKHHIRSFINVPENCKKKYGINKIKKPLSLVYKGLFVDIYCYSNSDLINKQKDEKWYKYIHQLLCDEFKECNFKSFNILNIDYETFWNKFPFLMTKQEPKQYEIFTRYPSIIIEDKLFLGDGDQAQNKNVMKDLGITHIVNMTQEIECAFEYDEELSFIKYLQCKIMDDAYTDIDQLFAKCINFIDNALKQNDTNKVLVHCAAGISRSSTIIIAYLMKIKHMKLDDAYQYTYKRRKIICPNIGFEKQLKSWEENGHQALQLDSD